MALLVVTGLFTFTTLAAKYQFDSLRDTLRRKAESQLGKYFDSRSISVVGLRGLQIRDFAIDYTAPRGQTVSIQAPSALILVDIMDLLSGHVTIDRLQFDGATIAVANARGTNADGVPVAVPKTPSPFSLDAFRAVGRDCTLIVHDLLEAKTVTLGSLEFDVYRLAESPDFVGHMTGRVKSTTEIPFKMRGRFSSVEDLDLRLSCAGVTPAGIEAFLSTPQKWVAAGTLAPSLALEARPGSRPEVRLDADVTGLVIGDLPAEVPPIDGHVSASATYDPVSRTWHVTRVETRSETFVAEAEGSVSLGSPVSFDLRANVSRFPEQLLTARLADSKLSDYGKIELSVTQPCTIALTANGSPEAPQYVATIAAPGGTVSFLPKDKRWPEGTLTLGMTRVAWDGVAKQARGALNIVDGTITHKETGITARKLAAAVMLDGDKAVVHPLQADITGNLCTGRLEYDLTKKTGELTLAGALSELEKTPLSKRIENTTLRGTAAVRGKVAMAANKVTIDAELDATRTGIAYRWYFDKEPGIGAVGNLRIDIALQESVNLKGDIVLASSPLSAELKSVYKKGKYRLQTLTASSDRLDISTVGGCLNMPYHVVGGFGTAARYQWTRRDFDQRTWEATTSCRIDQITLEAEGTQAPMRLKGVALTLMLDKGANPVGNLNLRADEAYMPPLRLPWFVPFSKDPEHKGDFQTWTYNLEGKYVEVPPWKGNNFTGEGYTTATTTGLKRYRAEIVGGGTLSGTFDKDRPENAFVATLDWTDVPSRYFLDYLNLPLVLSGPSSGQLKYSMDRDDPSTVQGTGKFRIVDGKFSEDFLYTKLQGRGTSEANMLPPSLQFTSLESDLDFERDVVKTDNVRLQSEGIQIAGKGQFIINGDMNYDLSISIAPETASRIPMLMSYFNVEGHRLSQQPIELVFKVTGPTSVPKGQLAQSPPARVTLVSGALEMTSEALKVIDTPRKILMDLLKLGGGLVGATK